MAADSMDDTTEAEESSGSSMCKPNCTIKTRHDRLLDDLANTRHASRSEALRTAIDDYAQSISEDGQSTVERLLKRVTSLSERLQNIEEKLEDLEQSHRVSATHPHAQSTAAESNVSKVGDEVDNSNDDHDLDNQVYKILSERGPLCLGTISSDIGYDQIEVREALDRLIDCGFVTCDNQSGSPEYRIQTPTDD